MFTRVLTDQQVTEIIAKYQAGSSTPKLATEYDVAIATIARYLNLAGIRLRPLSQASRISKNSLSEADRALAQTLYLSGSSCKSLSTRFQVSVPAIYKYLYELGTKMRSLHESHLVYQLNHDYFRKVDNQEQAYWLGFLAADGQVTGNAVRLGLAIKDQDHVERFAQAVSSNTPIGCYPKKHPISANLALCSEQMVADLNRCGIVERKSLVLTYADVSSNLHNHYIRGYFDGDGSVCNNGKGKVFTTFPGTEAFLARCAEIFYQEGITKKLRCVRPHHKSRIHILTVGGRLQATRLYHWLYDDSITWLPRKRARFKELLGL